MVYMCVICMIRESLEPLSEEYRGVLESLVSPAVKSADLRKLMLLICNACLSLIKTLDTFQKAAIMGVKHLMQLSTMHKKMFGAELIKEEPPGKSKRVENTIDTIMEIELETKPENNIQDWIKSDGSPCKHSSGAEHENEQINTDTTRNVKLEDSMQAQDNCAVFTHMKSSPCNVPQSTNNQPHNLDPHSALMKEYLSPDLYRSQLSLNVYGVNDADANNPTKSPQPQKGGKRGRPPLKNKASKRKSKSATSPGKSTETGKPRWYTRVFPHRNMLFARLKERSRPEFVNAPFRCSSCLLMFKTDEEMDAHVKLHVLGPDELPCKVCALPIHGSDENAHDAVHAVRHVCARCAFSTEHLNVIEAHDCSGEPVKKLRLHRKKIENPVICQICSSKYADEAALNRHMERMHKNPEEYKCTICNRIFNCKKKLSCHMSFHKKQIQLQENALSSLAPELHCAECNVMFASPAKYRAHRMTLKHTTKDTWKYECDVCKNKFPRKPFLKRHIRVVHLKEKVNMCNLCGKSVLSPGELRKHMERHKPRHARARPHVCELCGKAFTSQSVLSPGDLRKHKPRHARARPHVCELCGKAFTIKKSLTEHMSMHSGLRPHQCPLCPATFTYSAALFTHNRLKHLRVKRSWRRKEDAPDAIMEYLM